MPTDAVLARASPYKASANSYCNAPVFMHNFGGFAAEEPLRPTRAKSSWLREAEPDFARFEAEPDFDRRYLTRLSILNIGRYMAITMTPTIIPTRIIIRGSTIDVSDWIAASTSSS